MKTTKAIVTLAEEELNREQLDQVVGGLATELMSAATAAATVAYLLYRGGANTFVPGPDGEGCTRRLPSV